MEAPNDYGFTRCGEPVGRLVYPWREADCIECLLNVLSDYRTRSTKALDLAGRCQVRGWKDKQAEALKYHNECAELLTKVYQRIKELKGGKQ
jgi:hypothetical protein